jgi:hypothetical protein
MLGSFQILDSDFPTVVDPRGRSRRSPDGKPLYERDVFLRAEVEIVPGSWDVTGLRWHRQLRLDRQQRLPAGTADDAANRYPARKPVGAPAGGHLCVAGPMLGRAAPQRRHYRHRAPASMR